MMVALLVAGLIQAQPEIVSGMYAHIRADLQGRELPPQPPEVQYATLVGLIKAERANKQDLSPFLTDGAKQYVDADASLGMPEAEALIRSGVLGRVKQCQPRAPRLLETNYVRMLWDCGAGRSVYVTWVKFSGTKIEAMHIAPLRIPAVLTGTKPHG